MDDPARRSRFPLLAPRKPLRLVAALAIPSLLLACTSPSGLIAPDQDWAPPAAARPRVDLEFRLGDDLSFVSGTERVTFTPDLNVCELVFRAWPNKPATARRGNSLEVVSAAVGGVAAEASVSSAGGPRSAPGTLIEIPLPDCAPAGTAITVDLGFELELGAGTDERVGVARDGRMAWFGTAYPLLAWENGRGWAQDDAVSVAGETVTSETFELESLRVVAPSQYAVLGAGEPVGASRDASTNLTTHEFRSAALRDVTVTVGELHTVERRVAGSVVHVGGPVSGKDEPLDRWADEVADAVKRTSDYLGPVPDQHIWVSVIPDQTDGIEFPGAMQLGNLDLNHDRWLISHEVAHLWFYGLVGNNQARHPWLDESFASFVQQVVDDARGDPKPTSGSKRRATAGVGWPMSEWDTYRRASERYVSTVYGTGGDMLIQARQDAGPEAFDKALRAYLQANAHRIATPQDVERAFAHLPEVIQRMEAVGAI